MTEEALERIERIVRTLRPTDPGSWGPNIMYVTKEFEGFEAAVREECAKVAERYPGPLHTAHDDLLAKDIAKAIRTGPCGNPAHWDEPQHTCPLCKAARPSEGEGEVVHVCGLQGFGQSLDDYCPACRKQ